MKKFKKFLLLLLALIIICGVIISIRIQNKTYFNSETTSGNTSGNLLNGGLFCEDKDTIYFSNQNDDGALYAMDLECKKFKKISNDKAVSINSAGKYLYYTRQNYDRNNKANNVLEFSNTGVYRINKDGSHLKQLYLEPSGMINLYGNYLYYQHYSEENGLELYQVKIDGSDEQKISPQKLSPASIQDGILYYCDLNVDTSTYGLDLKSKSSFLISETAAYNCLAVDDYIYYMNPSQDYSIWRMKKDGTEPEQIVKRRCATYNFSVSGKYIFYQADAGTENGIYRFDLETGKEIQIAAGDYKNLHVTSKYIFFQQFKSDTVYVYPANGDGKLSSFNPPVIKK